MLLLLLQLLLPARRLDVVQQALECGRISGVDPGTSRQQLEQLRCACMLLSHAIPWSIFMAQ